MTTLSQLMLSLLRLPRSRIRGVLSFFIEILSKEKKKPSSFPLNSEDKHGILLQSEETLKDLNDFHKMIMQEEEGEEDDDEEYSLNRGGKGKKHHKAYDDGDDEEDEVNERASSSRDKKKNKEIRDEISENRKNKKKQSKKDHEENSDDEGEKGKPKKDGKSSPDKTTKKKEKKGSEEESSEDKEEMKKKVIVPTDEMTKSLLEENERLKKEMKAYDSNFFEEINDLKYRYTRLQEIVGEDPFLDNSISTSLNSRHHPSVRSLSPKGRKVADLPLNRLSWSTRSSMRAMDHANISSPLVRGRRNIERELQVGGNGRNSRSLSPSVYSSTKESLLLPTRLNTTGNSVIYDGGIHGIGEGRHFIGENDIGGGGTFSNLCERRLVFELSSHPNPAEVTSSLIHQ
jgi:hypothetical protein